MGTKQSWSYAAGEKGRNRVRAFEDPKTRIILLEWYEQELGAARPRRKRISTGHRDHALAKQQADELAVGLGKNEPPRAEEHSLRELFDMYLGEVTPMKGERKQSHDRACVEMFLRFFGSNCRPKTLNRRDWDHFIQERREGKIRPKGQEQKRTVRNRAIGYDLAFLMSVLNWATMSRDGRGDMLLLFNPLKGLPIPREENPNRPVVSDAEYLALLRVADEMDWRFRLMLVLVHETGHRVGAVRELQWSDIDLAAGSIRWRAEADKLGFEHTTPLTEEAIRALEGARRAHPAVGGAWVFPAPGDPSRPCSRHLVKGWWVKAEKRLGWTHSRQMGWHSLRRKFATELKDLPLKDLCHLGGWKNHNTILNCYQRPEEDRMREALAARKRLRVTGVR